MAALLSLCSLAVVVNHIKLYLEMEKDTFKKYVLSQVDRMGRIMEVVLCRAKFTDVKKEE